MIVLASQSPRRREILTQAGLKFTVRVPGVEEKRSPQESPEAYVERLARDKAASAVEEPQEFVLGADTIVLVDGEILEKPHTVEEAARMLTLLAGRAHEVLTGVCLIHNGQAQCGVERTTVRFAAMSGDEIAAYAASGEPLDKAGAYAIQGLASRHITGIEGCYFNVVGLPVARVYRMLKDAGYQAAEG
jgi:septum formation protein